VATRLVHAGSSDRRATQRVCADALCVDTQVRTRAGHQGVLVDLSLRGVGFIANSRLCPGARIELRLRTGPGAVSVCGRVVRCHVLRVWEGLVHYRVALESDVPIDLTSLHRGNRLPARQG
jgi:hypothetical protein